MTGQNRSGLDYPITDTPEFGQRVQVSAGIHWLRLPLPYDLNHINLWLLADGDGWTLVDTGVRAGATVATWDAITPELWQGKLLREIVVTHFHPDHVGLAGMLSARHRCSLYMTRETEQLTRGLLTMDTTDSDGEILAFCKQHGVQNSDVYTEFITGNDYRHIVSDLPEHCAHISDQARLGIGSGWSALVLDGHAEGLLCLFNEQESILISSDQVLPGITSNVSLHMRSTISNDPLADFLQSFERLRELPAETLVLPSHGRVFRGLHRRLQYLYDHHQKQLQAVLDFCRTPLTAATLAKRMFGQRVDSLNGLLAFGEALAHAVYLENQGLLQRDTRDGRDYFVTGT